LKISIEKSIKDFLVVDDNLGYKMINRFIPEENFFEVNLKYKF